MSNVIDFISIKNKKQSEQLQKVFSKANSLRNPQELNKLVEEKTIGVKDHTLFLAFLNYLEEMNIEPADIFLAVLKFPKHQFEERYQMKWQSIVQLCFTFLAIIKENDPVQYEHFISQQSLH